MIRVVREPTTPWWNLHSHSRYSHNDALPEVDAMVETVAAMKQPALGLTDHGNMIGSVQLYNECRRHGILPFPGSELYVVNSRDDKKAKRHHMCVVAFTTEGYENLVNLSTTSFQNFYHKPLLDMRDLAELSEAGKLKGIAATSGCYFGLVSQAIVNGQLGSAEAYLQSFNKWFDQFYVELQNHNIKHEDHWTDQLIVDQLVETADKLGLPCVITQDAHYCKQEDKHDHETLKRLVAFGPDEDDAVFPGDGFHLASETWIKERHSEPALCRGLEGLQRLLDYHELVIPELETYHYNVPFTVADPDKELKEHCEKKLSELALDKRYSSLLIEELDVIEASRMAGYLLTVKEVTDHCKEEKIFTQTRGSASGSLVCWLLGITQVDPIKWKLRYERFISKDRTKPPDIDLDVEHSQRQPLIEWLSSRFSVVQIGTCSTYSLSGDDKGNKGSLRVKYLARKRKSGSPVKEWSDVPREDVDDLYHLSGKKLISAYGVHPAGLVITTTPHDLQRLTPLMYIASSETFVTQYDGHDMEKLGFLKLDVLGSNTLSILNKAIDNLGKHGLDWIPLNDKQTFKTISAGRTEGVFQLEGGSAKRGVKELKPTKVDDVINAMALFRPAAMKTGATERFINRKHKEEEIPKRHKILMDATKDTQGIMIFQEQVIVLLKSLGMETDDLSNFLTAIKASNKEINGAAEIIDGSRMVIADLCRLNGMANDEFALLWSDIEGFAEYGFNKAHSTTYGITAYRCAYLATNYPLEFFAAVLNISAGTPKEDEYVRSVRMRSIKVKKADINISGASYEADQRSKCIRRGLLAIKGIGDKVAADIIANRPRNGYQSLTDFCEKVNPRKVTGVRAYLTEKDITVGKFGVLYEADVFREIA